MSILGESDRCLAPPVPLGRDNLQCSWSQPVPWTVVITAKVSSSATPLEVTQTYLLCDWGANDVHSSTCVLYYLSPVMRESKHAIWAANLPSSSSVSSVSSSPSFMAMK